MSITMDELLKGRAKLQDLSSDIQQNLNLLLKQINLVRSAYAKPMYVNSGYRRQSDNDKTQNAATGSAHLIGLAVDMSDPDGSLMKWVLSNLQLMKDLGFYMEDFRWTPDWVHFGLRPPPSKKRIFIPSSNPAISPQKWDGVYDHKFDN